MIANMLVRKSAQAAALAGSGAGGANEVLLTLDNPAGWLDGHDAVVTPEGALKLSAVYRAVDYICDFVAALPVYVYDRDNRRRVEKHQLTRLLSLRPNTMQTPAGWKRFAMRNLLLRGNSYAYIDRDKLSGRPSTLLPLHPDYMTPVLDGGVLQYFYTQPKTGQVFRLDANDLLHYCGNSEDGYTGKSVLHYAARTLEIARQAGEYEAAVYANGSRPSGVLETDTDLGGFSTVPDPAHAGQFLTKKEVVRRAWENAHGGSSQAFRMAVLDNGLKYTPLTVSNYDAQFIAGKNVTVADIARFFGVPLNALFAGSQAYNSNEQNTLDFVQGKGLALLRAWEEETSYKLLLDSDLELNYWIKFNLDARLRGDSAARSTYYRNMHEIGAYSVNDILALEDKPKVDGGDVHYASLNYVPLAKFEELSIRRNSSDGGGA